MIQKTLLTLVAVAILVGAGILSVRHYQQYKNTKQHSDTSVAQKAAADQKTADTRAFAVREQSLVQGFNREWAECTKGLQAYNALTPVIQKKISAIAPQCGTTLTQ